MAASIDHIDKSILEILQQDAATSLDVLSDKVNLSRNAAWRRIKQMEERGIITKRVALVNPGAVGCGLTVMVMIKTNQHAAEWLQAFQRTLATMPEIVGAYRMTGELDYILRVRVADVAAYDTFYKRLTSRISVSDVSASFVMEEIKETTAVPL